MIDHIRVLIVSIGAFENGPIAPDIRPIPMCCHDGRTSRSGCSRCASFFISWYAVKFAPRKNISRAIHASLNLTLVSCLSQRSETNSSVQCDKPLFPDDGVHRVRGISIVRGL